MNRKKGKNTTNKQLNPITKPPIVNKSVEMNNDNPTPDDKAKETTQVLDKKDDKKGIITKLKNWVSEYQFYIDIFLLIAAAFSIYFSYKAIDSSEKQFEIDKKPFLQIGDIEIANVSDSIKDKKGNHYLIKFTINNIGTLPALASDGGYSVLIAPPNTSLADVLKTPRAYLFLNSAIANGTKLFDIDPVKVDIPKWMADDVISGKQYIFLSEYINYSSYLNEKLYTYKFTARLTLQENDNTLRILENKNVLDSTHINP